METPTLECGDFYFTKHARVRQAQRAFKDELVDLLFTFAWPQPAGGGDLLYSFCDDTWAEVVEHLGLRAAKFERYRRGYLIETACGGIKTVAWKH